MTRPLNLLDLPEDIILMLPNYLHNIEDFTNLTSSCRTLRVYLVLTVSPKTVLRLASAASRIFFRPSPFFLVAAVARQLGEWARLSQENENVLAVTFQGGMEAVLELCLDHCTLTLSTIRELHRMRFSVINPVTDIIDKCIGAQWYDTPNFWSGGVDDAYTIDAEPSETLFHLAIYGELFGPDSDIILDGYETEKHPLSVDTRLEYVKYCIPDWACHACQGQANDVTLPDGSMDPRRFVHPTGPYEPGNLSDTGPYSSLTGDILGSQIGLKHLLQSSRWNPHWDRVRETIGPEFTELEKYNEDFENWDLIQFKQLLWKNVVQCQGLAGLTMISGGAESWRVRLSLLRDKIDRIQEKPERVNVGRNTTLNWPYLIGDLSITSSGYSSGT